jgi:Na+:H+ antiporter, NhaC family
VHAVAESQETEAVRLLSLADAIVPIQVALVLCCAVSALITLKNGHRWAAVQESGQAALSKVLQVLPAEEAGGDS